MYFEITECKTTSNKSWCRKEGKFCYEKVEDNLVNEEET